MRQLILASASPRRKELLSQIGVECLTHPVDIDESVFADESAEAYVERLARQKAQVCFDRFAKDMDVVIGSDTSVVIDGEVLGKPLDKDDAIQTLMRLSNRSHVVLTAVAVATKDGVQSVVVTTSVAFKALTQEECELYWATGEPMDKAGSYGIQGKAAVFVTGISGSYSSVVGLPLAETAELLKRVGVDLWC
jgi:septum formation protein